MRVLLDSCVPRLLVPHIRGHDVRRTRELGWADLKDAELLHAIAGQFEVLVTVDKSISYQQTLGDRPFAVIILRAKSNRMEHLARLVPKLLRTLKNIRAGEVREISD